MIKKISASLMCADLLDLGTQIEQLELAGIDYLHVDIMDNAFVPNITFGFDAIRAIRRKATLPLDIHLLVRRPADMIHFLELREGDILTIHAECDCGIMESAAFVRQKFARFGIALNPETPISKIEKYIPYVDVILLMLIVPGFSGSTMIHGIMDKVAETRVFLDNLGRNDVEISVDGSVSPEKGRYMSSLGASIFVGGTAGLFRRDMPLLEAAAALREAIGCECH